MVLVHITHGVHGPYVVWLLRAAPAGPCESSYSEVKVITPSNHTKVAKTVGEVNRSRFY